MGILLVAAKLGRKTVIAESHGSERARIVSQLLLLSPNTAGRPFEEIRMLLGDDHPGFPYLVASVLEPAFKVIGSASNGRSLIDAAMRLKPDVIVTDISMPILNGIEAALQLKSSGCGL